MIIPASAASSAPLSEVSSQGCATAVASGVQVLCRRDQPFVFLVLAQLRDNGLLGHGAGPFSEARDGASTGVAHHFRKRPTSPGMPPGKLMISACSL